MKEVISIKALMERIKNLEKELATSVSLGIKWENIAGEYKKEIAQLKDNKNRIHCPQCNIEIYLPKSSLFVSKEKAVTIEQIKKLDFSEFDYSVKEIIINKIKEELL